MEVSSASVSPIVSRGDTPCMARGKLRSKMSLTESQSSVALGVTVPLSNARDMFSVSADVLSEFIVNIDAVVPDELLDAAVRLVTSRFSKKPSCHLFEAVPMITVVFAGSMLDVNWAFIAILSDEAVVPMVVVAAFMSTMPVVVKSISPEPVVSCIWLLPAVVERVMVPLTVVNAMVAVPEVSIVMLPEESMSRMLVSMSNGTSVVTPSDTDVEPSNVTMVPSMSMAAPSMSNVWPVAFKVRVPLVEVRVKAPPEVMFSIPDEVISSVSIVIVPPIVVVDAYMFLHL